MNLLIVDDQSSVVDGLVKNIDWAGVGFETVFMAYNSAEARAVLLENRVDVMLCDIEMPVENGLSLVAWIREKQLPAACILLTSHMEFGYAQQAVRLGILDYIVQPAPYADIQGAVLRAAQRVQTLDEAEQLQRYGRIFKEQEAVFAEGLLRRFIVDGQQWGERPDLEQTGKLPALDATGYLVLLHLQREENMLDSWEAPLLQYALHNICSEIFAAYSQSVYLIGTQADEFIFILSGRTYTMDTQGVARQLKHLVRISLEHLQCRFACYFAGPEPVHGLPSHLPGLRRMREENVALQSGVFTSGSTEEETAPQEYGIPQYARWQAMLESGLGASVMQEAKLYLTGLGEQHQLTLPVLQGFYRDFIRLFSWAMEKRGVPAHSLFAERESFEIYRNGSRSLPAILQLIDLCAGYLAQDAAALDAQQFQVQDVIRYIHDNLESEIRRQDVADHFHMSADHLAKLFKKETGHSLKEYIILEKMKAAKVLLQTTALPVGLVASKVGYSNFSYFSRLYQKVMGVLPSDERQK